MKCSYCGKTSEDFPNKGRFLTHCKTHRTAGNKFYIPRPLLPDDLDIYGPSSRPRTFLLTGCYRGKSKGLEVLSIKHR
jgi:hypothetical protein